MDQILQVRNIVVYSLTPPPSHSLSLTHTHTHTPHVCTYCTHVYSLITSPHYQQLHSLQPQPGFHPTPGTPPG